MSKIDELISELCPEGVRRLSLGDLEDSGLIKLGRGIVISRGDLASAPGSYPVYSSSASGDGEFGRYGKYMFDDERISWSVDGGGRFFYRPAQKYSVTNVSGWLKVLKPEALDTRYLFHVLTNLWSKKIYNYTVKAHPSVIRVDYVLLIPPLEVQREIVSILDKFTQLEAELEAELEADLEARRSQFTFFVDQIFDLDGPHGAPVEKLEGICRITRASGLEKAQLQADGLPVVQYGEIHMHYDTVATSSRSFADQSVAAKLQTANPGDLVLVTTSEDVKDVGNPLVWMGTTPIGVGGESLIIKHDLDPIYLGMFFRSNSFYSQKLPFVNGSKVKRISAASLNKICIPVPPLPVQKKLGESLLALENLVNSAGDGLPAEITARRKQYEYYRNQLLTLKELETA
jgi:type I restriction enzyme S subunit